MTVMDCQPADQRSPSRDSEATQTPSQQAHVRQDDTEKQAPAASGYQGRADPLADAVDGQIKYNTMTWWQAGMIMTAKTVSLGILSLPSVLAAVGFVPGMMLIFGLGVLATYTGYTIGQFKARYPHVHNMADAGEILLGKFGREFFGAAQLVLMIFVCASHVLTFIIMMNTLTEHGTCSILFGVIGTALQFALSLPRTLKRLSYFSVASFVSIVAAVIIVMIGVGIEKPDTTTHAFQHGSFAPAFLSATNIVFAYAGHVVFFGFISELKEPKSFPKALFMLQIADTTMYLVVAGVIYAYAGDSVVSPALGSASPVVAKVAYGVAIPTIVIAGTIYGHVAGKYVVLRVFGGSVMKENSFKSWTIWVSALFIIWLTAWIIAEAIPVFNDLIGLVSALFASWFTYGLSAVFWLLINKGNYFKNWRKISLTILNILICFVGASMCGIGLYASGKAIHDNANTSTRPFSCSADTV